MTMTTLNVPIEMELAVRVHPVEGGGFWGEVPRFPGCLAQAATVEDLVVNIRQAVRDWLAETPEKTEDEARQLATLQGSEMLADASYPQPYDFLPPPSWSDDDE